MVLAPHIRLAFDRGTILVVAGSPCIELTGVPGLLWDPRVRAFRAPAWRHPELVNALARAGHAVDDARTTGERTSGWAAIQVRPYQDEALTAWELSGRRSVIVLPTGGGKTRVALAAMARTGLATLCLVPTRVLLEQWLRALSAVYPHPIGCFGDGVRELAPVTVATFESAYRHMERLGDKFDLLIVDEAHHFGAGMRDEALEMSMASARLGLTATPPRDSPAAERLGELIGPTAYELAIGDLAGRFLASFEVITLHLDLTDAERTRYERLMTTFRAVHEQFGRFVPGAAWQEFARAAGRTLEGRRALAAFRHARKLLAFTDEKRSALAQLLDRHRDARVIVFTADNESAYAVARAHLIMPLTCDIGRKERDDVLNRFRDGSLRALVSSRVLNEGLDVPDADVAVIVGGALGEREHVQRIGRLLRPAAGKRALVYELVTRKTMEVAQARRRRQGLAPRSAAAR